MLLHVMWKRSSASTKQLLLVHAGKIFQQNGSSCIWGDEKLEAVQSFKPSCDGQSPLKAARVFQEKGLVPVRNALSGRARDAAGLGAGLGEPRFGALYSGSCRPFAHCASPE